MFHVDNGLYFERQANGSVRVRKAWDIPAPGRDPWLFDITIPADVWASIVSTVSKRGETSFTWQEARTFHSKDDSEEKPRLVPITSGASRHSTSYLLPNDFILINPTATEMDLIAMFIRMLQKTNDK